MNCGWRISGSGSGAAITTDSLRNPLDFSEIHTESRSIATIPAPIFRGQKRPDGSVKPYDLGAFYRYTRSLPDGEVEIEVRVARARRSGAQNKRYFALLTVGAESLWGDPSLAEDLHEEIAHLLLALPACEKTGLRRRMHTPKLNTAEFTAYMDLVERKLVELGADLSGWGEQERKQERAA